MVFTIVHLGEELWDGRRWRRSGIGAITCFYDSKQHHLFAEQEAAGFKLRGSIV